MKNMTSKIIRVYLELYWAITMYLKVALFILKMVFIRMLPIKNRNLKIFNKLEAKALHKNHKNPLRRCRTETELAARKHTPRKVMSFQPKQCSKEEFDKFIESYSHKTLSIENDYLSDLEGNIPIMTWSDPSLGEYPCTIVATISPVLEKNSNGELKLTAFFYTINTFGMVDSDAISVENNYDLDKHPSWEELPK